MAAYLMADLLAEFNMLEAVLGVLGTIWLVLKVAAGIGFVIFVHELGHFGVARMCGVKCEKFLVGFDVPIGIGRFQLPRTLWKRQWGETEYAIGIIPFGGYVKMLGQDDNPANAEAEAERTRIRKDDDDSEVADGEVDDGQVADEADFELDPRSYTAKSVPQRMAIISAGVTMNVIFAVVFATIAYYFGVTYTPTQVGGVVAGSPAWIGSSDWPIEHLQAGDQILYVGEEKGEPDQQLRFGKDLVEQVFMAGVDSKVQLLVKRGDANPVWISVQPSEKFTPIPTIGVSPPLLPVLAAKDNPVLPGTGAAAASPPFKGGDQIVAIDGKPIQDYVAMKALLTQKMGQELTFTVKRTTKDGVSAKDGVSTEVDIKVGATPLRGVGLIMKLGPVSAVQVGSPAAQAGVKAGDLLVSLASQPIGDAFTLPQRLLPQVGKKVELIVLREGREQTLSIEVRAPRSYDSGYGPASPIGIDALGLAVNMTSEVAAVAKGSPAEKAGFLPADILTEASFVAVNDAERAKKAKFYSTAVPFDGKKGSWPEVHETLQLLPTGTKLSVSFSRSGAMPKTKVLEVVASKQWSIPQRGLSITQLKEVHTAGSFSEAVSLGFRETREQLMQVATVLKKLLTGKVAATNLAGPVSIAYVAGAEANQGFPRLLIFLTFMSCNLAIVNFLPIPVLDGGHMVFLIYEGIRGKPVDERVAVGLTLSGLFFVLCLMIFVFGLDFYRFAPWLGS